MAEKPRYPVFGSIVPYEPPLRDQIAWGIAKGAGALGADKYKQQWIARKIGGAVDLVPFLGTTVGLDETKREFEAGNYGKASLELGLAMAGLLPAGGLIKKAGKEAYERSYKAWAAQRGDDDPFRLSLLKSIPKPPERRFEADYPNGARADETGRLQVNVDGRPLIAPLVAGRNMIGQGDRALGEKELLDFAAAKGIPVRRVPAEELPGSHGMYRYELFSRKPKDIRIVDDLHESHVPRVLYHEIAHAIDQLSGKIPTHGLTKDFRNIYRDTAGLSWRHGPFPLPRNYGGPEELGYRGDKVARELVAEAIRAYLTNPNYLKTVAPAVAARIRKYVNENPKLKDFIQFNSLGGSALGAGLISSGIVSPGEEDIGESWGPSGGR